MQPALPKRDRDLALERELEGIGDQIEDDLLPHLAVDVDGLRKRRAVDDEPHPGAFDRGAEDAGKLRRQRRQVDGS